MATEESIITRGSTEEERRKAVLTKLNPVTMPLRFQIGLLGLVGFVLLPTQLYPDQMGPPTYLLYLIMFGMSWDVVSGYTGQLSFGHAFFAAMGGYTAAIMDIQHGITPLLGIPVGTLVAAFGGLLVGIPALRLRGPYLSLVTLIVPIIFAKLTKLFNDGIPVIAPGGLGGRSGLGIPETTIFGASGSGSVYEFAQGADVIQQTALYKYYLALAAMILVTAVLLAVTRSSAGSVFPAIREDEDAVAAAGLNAARFKLFAFVLSATVAGFAGALLVMSGVRVPAPETILGRDNIQNSVNYIIIAILGGTGTIVGPAVGGVVFVLTNLIIGSLDGVTVPLLDVTVASLTPLPLLAAAMAVLVFLPGGVLRGGLRAGRMVLAAARGEEYEGEPITGGEGNSALGEIIEKYRAEMREIIDERR